MKKSISTELIDGAYGYVDNHYFIICGAMGNKLSSEPLRVGQNYTIRASLYPHKGSKRVNFTYKPGLGIWVHLDGHETPLTNGHERILKQYFNIDGDRLRPLYVSITSK